MVVAQGRHVGYGGWLAVIGLVEIGFQHPNRIGHGLDTAAQRSDFGGSQAAAKDIEGQLLNFRNCRCRHGLLPDSLAIVWWPLRVG